jgi:transposase
MRAKGWTISAISRHLGRDRKTIRSHLDGRRSHVRSSRPDPLEPFLEYCRQRLSDNPHLPASILLSELGELGYRGPYSTFTRLLREHQLRPRCEVCETGHSSSLPSDQQS